MVRDRGKWRHRRTRRCLRVLVAGALVAGIAGTTETSAGAAPVWRVAPSPSPLGPPSGGLGAVSCPTSATCFAVGNLETGSTNKPLIERWNGTSWSVLPSPAPDGATGTLLSGISCANALSCFAVGRSSGVHGPFTLVERWNGKRWSVVWSPTPIGSVAILSGVSCVSPTSCVAVGASRTGGIDKTLVERWNGTRWMMVASPNPAGARSSSLNSVSCASATSCFAVGQYSMGSNNLLVEQWNGAKWSIASVPRPAGSHLTLLESVSCVSTTACFAVGVSAGSTGIKTLVEGWDGTSWSVVVSPNPVPSPSTLGLSAVSCSSATSCFAVGFLALDSPSDSAFGTMTEQWDGTSWSIVSSPDPDLSRDPTFRGVSCPTVATTTCIAVGGYYPSAVSDSTQATLAERWDGTAWSITALPAGASRSEFLAVSCPSATGCFAVGDAFDGTVTRPLLQRSNGTVWSTLPSPEVPLAIAATLRGVSCASPVSCFAVGSYATSTTTKTLVERWDGTRWSVLPSPNPVGASSTILHGVSCPSATSCFAVGTYITSGTWRTFAQRWDGTSWHSVPVPNPGHSSPSYLYAVSCSSARSCFAVGTTVNGFGRTLTERWNGTSWSIIAGPDVDGASTALFAASCVSATSCVAVGQAVFGEDTPSKAVAAQWNGTRWRVIESESPSPYFNTLGGVSCSNATTCFAVGTSSASQNATPTTLVERLTGKGFAVVSSPNPAGSTFNYLSDISCAGAANCNAVGRYEALGSRRTLVERYA